MLVERIVGTLACESNTFLFVHLLFIPLTVLCTADSLKDDHFWVVSPKKQVNRCRGTVFYVRVPDVHVHELSHFIHALVL